MTKNELQESNIYEWLLWLLRRRKRFRVIGASMSPLLEPGDIVLTNLRAYQQQRPCPGDIVIAYHPDEANLKIIKRVAAVLEDGRYHLAGDNALESSSYDAVPLTHILGRVTSRFS